MRIIVACEMSGRVRDAFIRLGHEAISCDLLPSLSTFGPHIREDIRNIDLTKYDLLIGHPPCTYLCNSGVQHLLKDPNRKQKMLDGCHFFNYLKNAPCTYVCIENPIPHKYARKLIGQYSQIIHPWQFGEHEIKATCLWLKNLPLLTPVDIIPKIWRDSSIHKASPNKNRAITRSLTFQGIADAMAQQWGNSTL